MKKNKILLLFIVILSVLIAYFFYCKTNNSGLLTKYDPKDGLTYKYEFSLKGNDTILNGKVEIYRQNGIIYANGTYKKNKKNGLFTYYDEKGRIESKTFIIDNKKKEYTWYFPNGKVQKYVYYWDSGEPSFLIKYDNTGPCSYEGSVLHRIKSKTEKNKIEIISKKSNQRYIHKYSIANIPYAKRKIMIENLTNKLPNKRIIKFQKPTYCSIEEIDLKKGENIIRTTVYFTFNNTILPTIKNVEEFIVVVN